MCLYITRCHINYIFYCTYCMETHHRKNIFFFFFKWVMYPLYRHNCALLSHYHQLGHLRNNMASLLQQKDIAMHVHRVDCFIYIHGNPMLNPMCIICILLTKNTTGIALKYPHFNISFSRIFIFLTIMRYQ